MNGELEIIIPVGNPDKALLRTAASLAAQTDRHFGVFLGDNHSRTGLEHLVAAENLLKTTGIPVRRAQPPAEMKRLEHWNWAHAQSQAACLKPLVPGEELKPKFVERLRERIAANAKTQLIRCDAELPTDWGTEVLAAPFASSALSPVEILNYFPSHVDWLSRSIHFAYGRTAWLALGGYSPQLPGFAALNLHVLLALHYGLENIPDTLATAAPLVEPCLNTNGPERVNHSLELWFILRQAKNYCLAARLPWPEQCLLWRGFAAALGRR